MDTYFKRRARSFGCVLVMLAATMSAVAGGWHDVPDILKRIVPPSFPEQDFPITDFGATGDGEQDANPALVRAIRVCNEAGGGRVVIPEGVFLSKGPVHLKSHVNLHLEAGAVLRFCPEPSHYLPPVLVRWEGTECYNYSPLIYADKCVNVAITGSGLIDGQAKTSFATWKPRQHDAQMRLRQMGNDGVPVHQRIFGEGDFLRPGMIEFYNCTNVLIEGVSITDSPFWVIHPVYSTNVTVRGVTVNSGNPNNDGCDPDSCTDVLIENCTFNTFDDSIAIKAGRDQDGWRVGRYSENIIVRNCTLNSICNGLCIGSEMSGGVRNVFVEDCTVGAARSVLYFKANLDRGGFVQDVFIRNVQVEEAKDAFVRFRTDYHGYRGNHFPPRFRDFVMEDVGCRKAPHYGLYIVGVQEAPIENVVLRNVTIEEAGIAGVLRHTDAITLDNLTINGQNVTPEELRTSPRDGGVRMRE